MFAVLLAVLASTRVGLIIQAALTHPDMVARLGHNVLKIFMPVFGAGALAVEIRYLPGLLFRAALPGPTGQWAAVLPTCAIRSDEADVWSSRGSRR
jgi:hypothetical protein